MAVPPLVAQTTYAKSPDRPANAAFNDAFTEGGAFTSNTFKGRKYWYFQTGTGAARTGRNMSARRRLNYWTASRITRKCVTTSANAAP